MPCPGGVLVSMVWKWWIWARANVAFWQVARVWCVGERKKCEVKPDFGQSAYKKQVTNQSFSTGWALLVRRCLDGMSGNSSSATQVEREQWGLSSMRVELFSLTAMRIRHAASKTRAVTLKKGPVNSLLFLRFCTVLVYCITLSILIKSRFILPLPAISVSSWLHWKQENSAQDRSSSECLPERNGFYFCNSHCFKLSVLGWALNCSPKRCLSFNMPVHEYCTVGREEARVLGKSLQTLQCTSGLIGKGLSHKHHS